MRAVFGPFLVAALSSSVAFVACTSDDAPHDPPADSGVPDTGTTDTGTPITPVDAGDAGDSNTTSDSSDAVPECFTNPKTHFEIINACTDAARLDKKPVGLPFLPDGALPPPP